MPPGDWNELGAALWVLVATNVSHAVKRRAAALGRRDRRPKMGQTPAAPQSTA